MISNDEITLLAQEALKKMLAEHGPDFTFPADVIWQYTKPGVHIPSTSRPHQPKRLMKDGFLEKTGGMVKAQSEARAGSSTAEYRFGEALVPRMSKAMSTAKATSVAGYLSSLQQQMDSEGYVISTAELANFYLAITVCPLVILSGISGTGKSLLPRKFASHTGSQFRAIPVQPQWSDNSDLFGFVPTLSPNDFVEGALIESIVTAKSNPNRLVIVLLDEMNLAPVENYFSDFLSVVETRRRVGRDILTDALPIDLPKQSGSNEKYSHLADLPLPMNIRVIGTANMDETTHTFSPKVLDRAFTIEFDDPDLTAFTTPSTLGKSNFSLLADLAIDPKNPISIQEARPASQGIFDEAAVLLQQLQDILSPAGIKFGYRTRDAILLYLHQWKSLDLTSIMTANAAFDFCLLQKILPKISGSGEKLSDALASLSKWMAETRSSEDSQTTLLFPGPFMRSHQKIERMIGLFDIDGATHFWGI